ncbi:snRNA transcription by RNA polymerase III [Branchiostoma belcheri]|nr:snRNA transcription by RNA polymerase III [Branchiostoma belcheri]
MSEEVGVTDADTEGAMPGLEVPNWCEGCAGCQALRKELQDKEAEHKRVWLAVKQRVISTDLLLKQNAEYKARYNAKAQDILKYRQKIEEASRQLASTERHCETLQMQLDSALKEMEPLKKRNRELEESQQKCRAEVEEARDRIRASEGLCQQYREVIKKFEDEEAAREANNSSEKKVSVAKLQEDLAKLKADLTSEKRKSRGLDRELDRAKVMIEGLQEQNSRVQQEVGEPASIPVVTPAKQPRTSHVTRTRTPKQKAPSPVSAMSCSNTSNETSDEEEEVEWSTVPNRGVLSPVRLLSPLSPLPPTPAPCRRDDRFSSSSDSSDDNSDMDDDADRIESELLGGTQSLPFSDTDVADEKANKPPKLSPVKSNYRNGIHRSPALKQSPTVNVSKENGKAQVKRFPRDRVNHSSPQKLTRSQVKCQDRRKRPPPRRVAKAAPMEEEIASHIESTKAAVENDCRSWFGEVEDLSDSESDSCLEKEKDREIKAKNGGDDLPPRHKTKTTGVTPSRYPLRSRSGDSKQEQKQEQNGDASFSPRKKNKSESDACDIRKKVNSPARTQYELRSRQDNKTDKIDDRIEAENAEDNTNVVNKSNDTLQEETVRKDLHEVDKKEEKTVDSKKLNNSLTEEESDKVEAVKPQSEEKKKMSSGHDKVGNSQVENNAIEFESKISSPPHVEMSAAPSVNKDPSNINTKAESDQESTEKPRSDSPEFRRPLTRSLSHGSKVNPGSRRDSSSSEREGDVSPKRVARLKTKLVSPVAGPSLRTRSRSSSSEKSLSDIDMKDKPRNSNTPKRVTRLQTKLISPVAGPSSRTRNRSSSSEKNLSDVDTKDSPPTKKATRLQTKLISPVAGPSSRTRNRSSSSEKSPSDVDTKDSPPNSNPPKRPARLQSKSLAGPSSRTRSRSLSSEKSLSDVDTKDNPTDPPNSNTPKRVTRLQTKLISPLTGHSSRTRKRSLSSEKGLSDVDTKDNHPKVDTPRRSKRKSDMASLSSSEKMTNIDTEKSVPKSVSSPQKSAKHLRTEDTSGDRDLQVYQEVVTKADELSDGARQSSAKDGANPEAPREEESACDTMEEGELSESETDVTDGVHLVQGSAASVQEHQGPTELCIRQQPGVSLPERESPQVSNRSNRSSLSTSPVSPLPPSPFESLALSPLPVSPLLLERPISPLPPSPWGRSATTSLSPSLPISPLRETPCLRWYHPCNVLPMGTMDAASPNTENPAHPSPCVFRSVAPKGAVQVKPKANRGRGAARSLSMGGKDAPSQNSLNSSSKKQAILFVQSEKTAWRSGKKNTQAAQDKQKSTTKANSRPTTLPIKPNSKQHPKTKPGKGTNAQNGQEKVNKGATCSQNGYAIAEETTTSLEESTRQYKTVKQTEKGKIHKGQSLTLEDEDKDKQTSEMSRLKEVDPDERIEEGKTKESSQVPDSETLSAAKDATLPKDSPCISGTSKRSLEEDVEDGEITGDESDEVVERRMVKKLRTEPRDKLTADHVLQYMNNMQGGATTGGAVNIIMEYLLQSEESRVDLFPKVKTMCETHNTKLPVMTTAEMAILGRVTYLAKFGQWEGLVSQVSHALYTEIRLNIRKEHLLATCRLYTGLCRLRGQLEQVRILIYDILREKLFFPVDRILTIVSVWPLVLQRSGSNLEDGPMSHVIELVVMSQHIAEDLKSCFRSLYQWKDVKDGDVNSMADRLVELLQRKETAALVNNTHRVKYPRLNPLMYETAKALELLASHQGWRWTHDHLIQTLLLPLLQKWRDNKKAKSIKSTVPQGTVVAIMQVIGCVGRIGLAEDKLSINQLQQVMIDLLNEAVKKPNSEKCGNPGKLLQMRCWTGPLALEGV